MCSDAFPFSKGGKSTLLYLICEKIRGTGTKVLLFGEGADEIFGGSSWFGLALKPFSMMPRDARSVAHHYAVSRTFLRASNWGHTRPSGARP